MSNIIRVSGHEYRVEIPKSVDLDEASAWCCEKFGSEGRGLKHAWRYGWVGYFDMKKHTFYFRKQQDALFFTLRWL